MKQRYRIFKYTTTQWEDIGQLRRAEEDMAVAFCSQPWYDWLFDSNIKFTVETAKDMANFATVFVVIAEFEPQQLTYFLLKWPRG